jgi:hypothetical protein
VSEPVPEPTPLQTRAARRAQRRALREPPDLPVLSDVPQPGMVVGTVGLSALIALAGFAHPMLVALAVGAGGLVMAWGWPALLGLPSRRGAGAVLVVATLVSVATAALTRGDPYLRWMPAALAVSLIAVFVHQLLRRDGRPRLAQSVAASGAGVAIVSTSAGFVALPRIHGGSVALAAAMAALAASALPDLLVGHDRARRWLLPICMAVGGVAALSVAAFGSLPGLARTALLGILVAGVAHALRRVLAVLPPIALVRSQLVAGVASVLLCGVVVYVVARLQ